MKCTLREAVGLGKYQTVVDRLMTPEEARQEAVSMGLEPSVVEWIVGEFSKAARYVRDGEDEIIGSEGRIACGQSWETVNEALAEAMGHEDGWNSMDEPDVRAVWDVFFEE